MTFEKDSRARADHWVLPVIAAMFASSCSFLFVSGPPPPEERRKPFDCTSSMTAPAVDGMLAVLVTLGLVYTLAIDESDRRLLAGLPRDDMVALGLGSTILYTGSMISGIVRVSRCQEAVGSTGPVQVRYRELGESERRKQNEMAEEAAVRERVKAQAAVPAATPSPAAVDGGVEGPQQE